MMENQNEEDFNIADVIQASKIAEAKWREALANEKSGGHSGGSSRSERPSIPHANLDASTRTVTSTSTRPSTTRPTTTSKRTSYADSLPDLELDSVKKAKKLMDPWRSNKVEVLRKDRREAMDGNWRPLVTENADANSEPWDSREVGLNRHWNRNRRYDFDLRDRLNDIYRDRGQFRGYDWELPLDFDREPSFRLDWTTTGRSAPFLTFVVNDAGQIIHKIFNYEAKDRRTRQTISEWVFSNIVRGQSTTRSEIMERHRGREYGFRRNNEATSRYAGGRFRGGNVNVGNRYHEHGHEDQRHEDRHQHHGRPDRQERDGHDRPDSRRGYTRLQFRGRFPRK